MHDAQVIARIRRKYRALAVEMDERIRRQWAAAEARELGYGGASAVARATQLSPPTITAGRRELKLPAKKRTAEAERIRRPGGGRRAATDNDPELIKALEALIEPMTWPSGPTVTQRAVTLPSSGPSIEMSPSPLMSPVMRI